MNLVPFVRYSDIVTQSGLSSGSVKLDDGSTNKDFLTVGLAYFLNPNFVVKADYRWNLNGSSATATSGANQDYFQLGAGVFF
jgi:predicted porin